MGKDMTMCEFKVEEHRMRQTDVRRVARDILLNNAPNDIYEDVDAIATVYLANVGAEYRYGVLDTPEWGYWQPDPSHYYNDYHVVSGEQYAKVRDELVKQTARIRKLLKVS